MGEPGIALTSPPRMIGPSVWASQSTSDRACPAFTSLEPPERWVTTRRTSPSGVETVAARATRCSKGPAAGRSSTQSTFRSGNRLRIADPSSNRIAKRLPLARRKTSSSPVRVASRSAPLPVHAFQGTSCRSATSTLRRAISLPTRSRRSPCRSYPGKPCSTFMERMRSGPACRVPTSHSARHPSGWPMVEAWETQAPSSTTRARTTSRVRRLTA